MCPSDCVHYEGGEAAGVLQPGREGCRAGVCIRYRANRPRHRRDPWDDHPRATAQCLANIRAILEEAGSSMDKVASMTVVLADEDDFAGMNEEWLKWLSSNPPARQGAKLPARIPGLKVSIAAIAEA